MNKEPPESFIEDNRNIVGNENIAKHFINFFTNIGSSLGSSISSNIHPEIYLSNSNPKTLFLFPTNETEILKTVGKHEKQIKYRI